MKSFYVGSLLLCLVACSTNSLNKDIQKFKGSAIDLSLNCVALSTGQDAALTEFVRVPIKMIVWFNTEKCASCQISKMYEWNDIINFALSLNGKFNVIFLFTPKPEDLHKVNLSLRSHKYDYPIFIDTRSDFPNLNFGIPSDSRLHTFLLDKNNKVVLVGNPLHNEKLWELYKSTIRDMVNNSGVLPE